MRLLKQAHINILTVYVFNLLYLQGAAFLGDCQNNVMIKFFEDTGSHIPLSVHFFRDSSGTE